MNKNNKIILISQENSKRKEYFFKGAEELEISVEFLELGSLIPKFSKNTYIKIDPPKYQESDILKGNILVKDYRNFLSNIGKEKHLCFLNHPKAILNTLDKKYCKKILIEKNIPTTPLIEAEINNIDELRVYLIKNKINSIFIKPRYGAGAAGIIAYRLNPRNEQEIIYTSVKENNNSLINTKKISKINSKEKIKNIVNIILARDHIIEKWISKPKIDNVSYDIRVLYQFGKIAFMVARGSRSPITNLHLNNNAIEIEKLNLSKETIKKIDKICNKAMKEFEGLNYAGIDLILKGKKQDPVIIEINAQGDLIYKDIFEKNKIYKEQIRRMKNNEN